MNNWVLFCPLYRTLYQGIMHQTIRPWLKSKDDNVLKYSLLCFAVEGSYKYIDSYL